MSHKKHKQGVRKRPNPVLHMALWGMVASTILTITIGLILLDHLDEYFLSFLFMSVIFGTIPGIILGIVCGIFIWTQLRSNAEPDFQLIYALIFFGVGVTFSIFLRLALSFPLLMCIGMGAIAGIAACIATYRYARRFYKWQRELAYHQKPKNDDMLAAQNAAPEQDYRHQVGITEAAY